MRDVFLADWLAVLNLDSEQDLEALGTIDFSHIRLEFRGKRAEVSGIRGEVSGARRAPCEESSDSQDTAVRDSPGPHGD